MVNMTRKRSWDSGSRRIRKAGQRSRCAIHGTMIGADHPCEPVLQLTQRQGGLVFRIVVAALVRVGEGRSRQFVVDYLHRRTDNSFHDAARVRLSQRTIVQPDAMLLAATA